MFIIHDFTLGKMGLKILSIEQSHFEKKKMYKRLFKCVYTEKILKDLHEIHPNPNNGFSYVIGVWMTFIFPFVCSILPKFPQ